MNEENSNKAFVKISDWILQNADVIFRWVKVGRGNRVRLFTCFTKVISYY